MLEKLGYDVDTADDGAAAVDAFAAQPYDLILMDCRMPIMDGYEATEEIRKREDRDRHTPIIALTASAMADDRRKCREAGMDDYLAKPVKREILTETLRRWIR